MPKTLTDVGIAKQARRFAESIHHAVYKVDGVPGSMSIFRTSIDGDIVRLYVYFNDTIIGRVSDIQLIDNDGDIVCESATVFTKPQSKGLYLAFKYKFVEVEVESVETI